MFQDAFLLGDTVKKEENGCTWKWDKDLSELVGSPVRTMSHRDNPRNDCPKIIIASQGGD